MLKHKIDPIGFILVNIFIMLIIISINPQLNTLYVAFLSLVYYSLLDRIL